MTIPKDDKDWTWVLNRRCPECGLAPGDVDAADVPAMTRANAAAWRDVLTRPDARAPAGTRRVVPARVRLPRA